MGFLDSIKSAVSGNLEGKLGEAMEAVIAQVKPLIASGKVSEVLKAAVENYGDLGEKLNAILAKLGTASADAKTGLVSEKNDIVKQIKEKGSAILDAAKAESAVPDSLKDICAKAEALLKKL